jgi:hypothetical protein
MTTVTALTGPERRRRSTAAERLQIVSCRRGWLNLTEDKRVTLRVLAMGLDRHRHRPAHVQPGVERGAVRT